jgi:heat shock protein HslJ
VFRSDSVILAGSLLVVLAACTSAPPAANVDGREFLSVRVTEGGRERPLVPGTRVRIGFSDGSLSASAGCNHIGGPYRIDGARLVVGELSMTAMGCDAARHAQDEWLSRFVGAGPAIALDGTDLVLEGGGTRVALVDSGVAEPSASLVGPVWAVEGLVTGETASSIPARTSATLQFGADGRVSVFAGCNSGGGPAQVGAGTIDFGDIALTRMACPGPPEDVERAVLAVLAATLVEYEIDGASLRLRAGNAGLDLRALPGVSSTE